MILSRFLPSSALPAYATWQRFNAPLFSLYVLLHGVALAGFFTFSWQGLLVMGILSFSTICLGITLCYHRLLAHQSYQLAKPLTYVLALLGCLAFQRGPIWWTATHRLHHGKTDKAGDPHSPKYSVWWAHFLWPFFWHPQLDESEETLRRLAPDLWKDPGLRFLERYYSAINVLFLGLLFGLGYWLGGGLKMGLSILVWGGFLRIIYGLNVTWLVNSAAHLWGYRRYDTPDTSRNNWWVALLTWGEGWHNNHHAHARSAKMGFVWYELDVTYWIIALFRRLGLATQVVGSPLDRENDRLKNGGQTQSVSTIPLKETKNPRLSKAHQ
ncbi:acyl-CoA desaturase [Vampirovibrio chlorellavorus]|uniref:acyl-CoA desaturase n=1 Tax=Vampirovibrio chlorellavorus TaxID=758823 RepID=UPI0026EEFADA|nr:acyl-CoA desaturase [Vampirovibrio chlorellavorus]